jgi:hypothetical protein
MTKQKLCNLVWDTDIYPRTNASDVNVSRLVAALESGSELPPIVVEKKTLRIIDGVHRWKAQQRVRGGDAVVDVIERSFKDDNEAFLASIELNAAHGLTLTPFEITRNAVRAEQRGITLEMLAHAVHMPIERIERRLTDNTGFSRTLGAKVALKGSMKALAGSQLTQQQDATNKFVGGMSPLYYIHQLQSLIQSGLYQWGSANEKIALAELFATMQKAIEGSAA